MALSSINKVRSYIGDMDKAAVQENVARGDGVTTRFQLDMNPVRTGTYQMIVSGVAVSASSIDEALGVVYFTAAPTAGATIQANYQYNALSDDEVQDSIDIASGAGLMIAGAICARKLASNQARFFAYTQGEKHVDKRFIGLNLMRIAESLEKGHDNLLSDMSQGIKVATFDDSGTEFDGYDTASSVNLTSTS